MTIVLGHRRLVLGIAGALYIHMTYRGAASAELLTRGRGVCVGCAIRPSVRFNTAARRGSPAVYSGAFFIDVLSNHHRPGEVGSVNLTAWFEDDSAQCRLNAV